MATASTSLYAARSWLVVIVEENLTMPVAENEANLPLVRAAYFEFGYARFPRNLVPFPFAPASL